MLGFLLCFPHSLNFLVFHDFSPRCLKRSFISSLVFLWHAWRRKLKVLKVLTPSRFSRWIGGIYVPAPTQHHAACFKRRRWNFSQHKWSEIMQNSNTNCQKLHVSKAKNETQHTVSIFDDKEIVEKWWKYLSGNKKNRVNVFAACLGLLEDWDFLGTLLM